MAWSQIIFGVILVVVLLVLAALYGVRQFLALRRLPAAEEMPLEERDYLRSRSWRRLVMSLLLLLLGVMLAAALVCLEAPAQRLADRRAEQEQQGDASPLDSEQRTFVRLYIAFWIAFLLVLMAVVFLAAADLWATRRYSVRQHRKLIADRRAMIERELSRRRQERNGFH